MCVVDERRRLRRTARLLDEREGTIAVETHSPNQGVTSHWSLDCVLESGGVPSAILTRLAAHDLELRDSHPVGGHWRFVAVAE